MGRGIEEEGAKCEFCEALEEEEEEETEGEKCDETREEFSDWVWVWVWF